MTSRLDDGSYDVVVIGGGMAGAGVARDLALRGVSVALVEKGDFAWGTTSRSSKLIHGGLRYLELLDFGLVRESLRERETLHRLDLLEVKLPPPRHAFIRLVTWTGSRLGKATVAVLLVFVWFTFVAQIFISEFLNYHPAIGWLNQPLVQLPWFKYIPPHLK